MVIASALLSAAVQYFTITHAKYSRVVIACNAESLKHLNTLAVVLQLLELRTFAGSIESGGRGHISIAGEIDCQLYYS